MQTLCFQHDRIEEYFFQEYIIEFVGIDSFNFDNIFELCRRNKIYYNGLLRYFIILFKQQNLKLFKDVVITYATYHMDIIPKMVVEALTNTNDLAENLNYIVNKKDFENSKKMLSIILLGLDSAVQIYSSLTEKVKVIVDELSNLSLTSFLPNEDLALFYYLKSKVYYYSNDYDTALENVNSAVRIFDKEISHVEIYKMYIHNSVILMELGFSKKAITILENEYKNNKEKQNLCAMLETGIELGRAYTHSGQTTITLALYNELLKIDNIDANAMARICEQKANVLNNIMYHELQYGFHSKEKRPNILREKIDLLFKEAVDLYQNSMDILYDSGELFTYSGVVPEKINTFISYSFSVVETGIEECEYLIDITNKLFSNFTTPFKTDFYLAWAYYYEYKNDIVNAQSYITKAFEVAEQLNIKNKQAKCHIFFSQFAYRRIFSKLSVQEKENWCIDGLMHLEKALNYYNEHAMLQNNLIVQDALDLKAKFKREIT